MEKQRSMFYANETKSIGTIAQETNELFTLSEHHGWNFKFLGFAQMPQQPIHLQNWMIVPATQDTTEIPARTYQRIQTIFAQGIRPKGFVVVHEAPRLLNKPTTNFKKIETRKPIILPQKNDFSQMAISVLKGIFLGTSSLIMGAFSLGLAMLDPIVIAVLEDDSWIEIDRWNTPA